MFCGTLIGLRNLKLRSPKRVFYYKKTFLYSASGCSVTGHGRNVAAAGAERPAERCAAGRPEAGGSV